MSKEFLGSRLLRATVATVALATATPNFELRNANAQQINSPQQINLPHIGYVDLESLLKCKGENGVKHSRAVIGLDKDTEVTIIDRSDPLNGALISQANAGVRITEGIDGKTGPSIILTPAGEQLQYLQEKGVPYVTKGEKPQTIADKTVIFKGVKVGPDGRTVEMEFFCNTPKTELK